jgi:hypothetical protein
LLCKSLYYTFSDDFNLSLGLRYSPEPSLKYDDKEWSNMLKTEPQVYRKQGIYTGLIDNLAEALIKYESRPDETAVRIKSFSEFQQEYIRYDQNNKKNILQPFTEVSELFKNFHPKTMPILWRILLVQVHIDEAMKKTRELPKTERVFKTLKMMAKEERQQYDWRKSKEELPDLEVFDKPFDAIHKYIVSRDNLKELLATNDFRYLQPIYKS